MATTNPIVTAITGYVEEHNEELLTASILGAKSASLFNLQSDVKGPTALNIMSNEIVFGDGSACGWDESGSTEFSHRILTPKALKVNMAFCDKKMLSTWANYKVRVAAGQKELPFEDAWVKDLVANIDAKVEKMLYQGSSANTAEFAGLVEILSAETGCTKVAAASGTAAYTFIKSVAKAIPAEVKNPAILVAPSMYREYMQDLVSANLYHYDPANGANEYALPGTDIKVIAVDGLEGVDVAIAANLDNIYYGVSADGDQDKFELWYSQDNREFRFCVEFIAGVQVAFPDEVVLGKRG